MTQHEDSAGSRDPGLSWAPVAVAVVVAIAAVVGLFVINDGLRPE